MVSDDFKLEPALIYSEKFVIVIFYLIFYLLISADKMLTSKPSVAAVGSLKDLPEYKDIELALLDKSGLMKTTTGQRMFRLFR